MRLDQVVAEPDVCANVGLTDVDVDRSRLALQTQKTAVPVLVEGHVGILRLRVIDDRILDAAGLLMSLRTQWRE